MRRVHLDHNATTPMRPEVREVFLRTLDELAGNPSSVHASGRAARAALDEARERAAAALGVFEEELYFTSGGTEANHLALRGALAAAGPRSGLATTAVEHSSVLRTAEALAAEGHPVEIVGVDATGRPDVEDVLVAACRPAALVSVMAANNEVGTLLPVAEIGRRLAELDPARRPLFHTDAVQAVGRVPVSLRDWHVDLASLSLHKLGGPRGVGILFKRAGAALARTLWGGEQEGGYRPGTENLPGICAAVTALECAVAEREEYAKRVAALRDALWHGIVRALPGTRLLGAPLGSPERLPNTLNVLLKGVESRTLVARLDLAGLEASAGSACASGSLEPSHVLRAMGLPDDDARAGLRLSLGRETTAEDVCTAVDILRRTCARDDVSRCDVERR